MKSGFFAALLISLATASCSPKPFAKPALNVGLKNELEIKNLFESNAELKDSAEAKRLKAVTDSGKRAYDWLQELNKTRPKNQALSYSSQATTSAPTPENPKIYNGDLVLAAYSELLKTMPDVYREVLEGIGAFPSVLPVSETEFLEWGLKVVNTYDTAARWILMQDTLGYYETKAISDMRGYYFLSRLPNRNEKFATFSSLPQQEQSQLREWIIGICINSQGFARFDPQKCVAEIALNEKQNTLVKFYDSHQARSKEIWNLYFELDSYFVREDVVWNSRDANTLHYPFLKPTNPEILAYLRDNVEGEWQQGPWKLKIDFTTADSAWSLSRLEFQKDAYAHAERNRIVMDESEPRTEYLSQWTIRHEFGHLLGFKDCYAEFYDSRAKVMVNYALDPSNIMCSRLGKVQPQHIALLRAQYYQ